ncbi:MAG: cysteine hydrolase [Lachnospiraceae bacterium]|nr:cysteine hydrolase [Lachnospiraceae bacterium]
MNKVLVVVDMQNDFISGSLGSKMAEAIVENVIKKIINFDGKIAYTRDTHYDNYMSTREGKLLPIMHCTEGTEGWEIESRIKALQIENDSPVFDKITFGSKRLADFLLYLDKLNKIDEVHVVGLCTDICVISNAFLAQAYLPEATIVIDATCCAGVTEDSHKTALTAMSNCQMKIINI